MWVWVPVQVPLCVWVWVPVQVRLPAPLLVAHNIGLVQVQVWQLQSPAVFPVGLMQRPELRVMPRVAAAERNAA